MENADQEETRLKLGAIIGAASGVPADAIALPYRFVKENALDQTQFGYSTPDLDPGRRLTDAGSNADPAGAIRAMARELARLVAMGAKPTLAPAAHSLRWYLADGKPAQPKDLMNWSHVILPGMPDAKLFAAQPPATVGGKTGGELSYPDRLFDHINVDARGHIVDLGDLRFGPNPRRPESRARSVGQAVFESIWIVLRTHAQNRAHLAGEPQQPLEADAYRESVTGSLSDMWQAFFGTDVPMPDEIRALMAGYIENEAANGWVWNAPGAVTPGMLAVADYYPLWAIAWYFAKQAYIAGEQDETRQSIEKLAELFRNLRTRVENNGGEPIAVNRALYRDVMVLPEGGGAMPESVSEEETGRLEQGVADFEASITSP